MVRRVMMPAIADLVDFDFSFLRTILPRLHPVKKIPAKVSMPAAIQLMRGTKTMAILSAKKPKSDMKSPMIESRIIYDERLHPLTAYLLKSTFS